MEYLRPQSVEDAGRMAQLSGSHILAGGTDLLLQMREGKVEPTAIIDIGKIAELRKIQVVDEQLEIGCMVTFAELIKSELVHEHARALWLAAQTMGSPQIRNQATIGGNLGNCSPAADGLPPLLALDATVELFSASGQELVALTELLERRPLLALGSLITKFRIPLRGWQTGFAKLGRRRALAIARLNVAIAVEVEGSRAKNVRVAFGAVGKRAFLSEPLGRALSNQEMDDRWVEQAVGESKKIVRDALGARASASYKRAAVGGVMREALTSFMAEGGENDGFTIHSK